MMLRAALPQMIYADATLLEQDGAHMRVRCCALRHWLIIAAMLFHADTLTLILALFATGYYAITPLLLCLMLLDYAMPPMPRHDAAMLLMPSLPLMMPLSLCY